MNFNEESKYIIILTTPTSGVPFSKLEHHYGKFIACLAAFLLSPMFASLIDIRQKAFSQLGGLPKAILLALGSSFVILS